MNLSDLKRTVNSNKLLFLAVFALIFLYLIFFPSMYTAIDEHEYAKNALLLSQGKLIDADPLDYPGGYFNNGHYISSYFLGKSVFLILFIPFGLSGLIGSNLILHLANMLLLVFIFKHLKIDKRFAVLYLLFPAFVWITRTLYSELLVLMFLLAGTLLYLQSTRRKWLLAGFLFGLAVMVRYDSALLFAGFAFVSLLKNRSRLLYLLAGFAIVGLVILGINSLIYGAPFETPYGYSAGEFLTGQNPAFFLNLLTFIAILLIAYPLMLLSPLLSRKKFGLEVLFSAIAFFYLFSRTTNLNVFEFFSPLTFTARMRYFVPLAGLLMIPYAGFLQNIFEKIAVRFSFFSFRKFFIAITIILFSFAIVLSSVHQDFLQKRVTVQEQLFQTVPENSLVVGSSDDAIYFLKGLFGDRKYIRVDTNFIDVYKTIQDFEGPVFIMQLEHSNQSDSAVRQETINNERQKIADFINANIESLSLVFETKEPHLLKIYKLK